MFTDPVKNLRAFGIREDAVVADLGAGTGFYSVAAGHKDFLMTIKNKVRDARLNNVEILWGDVEKSGGTKLRDSIVDSVIASNILHQVKDKEKFILEIKRILKPRGRVLLVDLSPFSVLGAKMIIPKNKAREVFEKAGLVFEREIDAGAHHYGMIFVKE
ncbi:MAG: Methylase involved in ubiquinone/menaquinone biosynthesis [Parcubacteria group bacterium GW2011_GWF2_42_7]|nr:MAG: Methylase involved in ubiquinone/menaquinone biosynthesis [Parcubacteria group bacterium GW2011_GWF2_42_7]